MRGWTTATENSLTGYEPNLFDIPEDYEGTDAIFRDANVTQLSNYDFDRQYPDTPEVDEEHFGSAFASPPLTQKTGARADLTQTYHSNEESLLRSAPSISVKPGKPSSMMEEQKSSQELEDERFTVALQIQREQILAEAKFEIQKHE